MDSIELEWIEEKDMVVAPPVGSSGGLMGRFHRLQKLSQWTISDSDFRYLRDHVLPFNGDQSSTLYSSYDKIYA